MFSSPAAPPPPPPPPSPPQAPQYSIDANKSGRSKAYGGFGSTILTSAQGDLTPANTAKKTLLGQ